MRGRSATFVYSGTAIRSRRSATIFHMPKDKPVQLRGVQRHALLAQKFDDRERINRGGSMISRRSRTSLARPRPRTLRRSSSFSTLSSWQENPAGSRRSTIRIYCDNAPIKSFVKDLTAGLKTGRRQGGGAPAWSAQEIRTRAFRWEKGRATPHHRGRCPSAIAAACARTRPGWLVTLMRSAGYDVWPALTMAGARVEEVPADN